MKRSLLCAIIELDTDHRTIEASNYRCEPDLLRDELLHELFEQQAEARGDAVALLRGDERVRYGELERRANQLARLLRQRGVGRECCVALWLPRSTWLYAGLLGILKAGAAYVPIDPNYPAERVGFILSDCRARLLLTTKALAARAPSLARSAVLTLDDAEAEIASQSAAKLTRAETGLTPADLCYVIYTSGSTGTPKGVQIEHQSVCHLVRAEGRMFQVRPEDRVYQGFSIAFDASVEEVWLAFFAGAMLVVATPEMERAGPGLSRLLTEAGVSLLSCVPTLLSMAEGDIPTLRLLIFGGEVCPPDLVKRWWKPARRIFNTYGPTEASVIATCAECHPDSPVTIGRPLPNYFVCILDDQMQAVQPGVPGQLCIGGIGLARGYLGRPDLTREKFVPNPLSRNGEDLERLYQTGDLACWTAEGNIQFLGRIDTQVKIRGFRVELSEIESILLQCPGVQAAAIALREDVPGRQQLVGYVVPQGPAPLEETLRARLRLSLPDYMVPAVIETLAELPTLPSGKIDRKNLPPPRASHTERPPRGLPPRTALEKQFMAAWERLFAPLPVSIQDDFFLDLGGHSLLAARMVSELRRQPPLERLSMLDVYRHPTIEALAAEFDKPAARKVEFPTAGQSSGVRPQREPDAPQPMNLSKARIPLPLPATKERGEGWGEGPPDKTLLLSPALSGARSRRLGIPNGGEGGRHRVSARSGAQSAPSYRGGLSADASQSIPFWRHFCCGVAQLVSLPFILSFFAVQWLGPYLVYTVLTEEGYDFLPSVLGACASLVLLYPVMLLVPIGLKWLVIGRYKPGSYPLWGAYFFRWWLVTTFEAAVPVSYLAGTPWLNFYLRLMGAKVGPDVHLDTDSFVIYDLLSIGEGSSINVDANLLGYTVENGRLRLGPITIGRNCFVGVRSALREDTVMENNSALEDLSLLSRGATIPAAQTWRGSPAALSGNHHAPAPASQTGAPARASTLRRLVFASLHGLGLLTVPLLVSAAIFPGIVLMNTLNYLDPYYWYLCVAPLVGLTFVVLLCLEIAAVKWLLLGRVKPGRHPLLGFFYLRKWFVDKTMDLSLDVLGPLYASIYLGPWYRLLGAKLGKGAEISTASFISPDLLSIGEESFIADSVSLGAPRVRDGFLTLGHNHIGKRSFIGNSAMLPPGAVIGDMVLIGCLSAPPLNPADASREDSAWLGSPSILLPQRQKSAAFSEAATFNPSAGLRALRALIEFVRVISSSTCFIILISLLFSALLLIRDYFSLGQTLWFFPVLYISCGVVAALFTVAAKWTLVWRYRPCEKPLWHTFVWRNELLNALHEHLAEPFLVGALTGTPFICWYFRLLGARIGRRVYLETTDLSEFDLARIGDESVLNADCTIQTHLFEDRIMKMSTITIGPRCKVGAGSLVLYDTLMEEGAALDDLSLLMKGEVLPARTSWQGVPARPAPTPPL